MADDSITCPVCKRVSHNLTDVQNRYCGACHVFHNEMGRELKASELQVGTVVIITKEGRNGATTQWVKDISDQGVIFYAGVLNLYSLFFCVGEELHDEDARLHVYQYLGGDAPTSGTAQA
jgi:hypothetical protein